jgi:hypothetical protein
VVWAAVANGGEEEAGRVMVRAFYRTSGGPWWSTTRTAPAHKRLRLHSFTCPQQLQDGAQVFVSKVATSMFSRLQLLGVVDDEDCSSATATRLWLHGGVDVLAKTAPNTGFTASGCSKGRADEAKQVHARELQLRVARCSCAGGFVSSACSPLPSSYSFFSLTGGSGWYWGKSPEEPAACSGLSATGQQYFSLRTNQPPTTSQQYFSLRIIQHHPSATSQTNRLPDGIAPGSPAAPAPPGGAPLLHSSHFPFSSQVAVDLGEKPWRRQFLGDGWADGIYRDVARVWRRDGRCAAIWGGVASIWGASTTAGGGHGRPPEPVLAAPPRWCHGRRQGKRWRGRLASGARLAVTQGGGWR